VYGHCYDVAIGNLGRHAVLAPGIGAISGHLTVHCPVVGFRFFGIGPDFAWVVGDPEVARPLGVGRVVSDPTVREDYVLIFVVFGVCEGGEREEDCKKQRRGRSGGHHDVYE
jgi:hypothetical protein